LIYKFANGYLCCSETNTNVIFFYAWLPYVSPFHWDFLVTSICGAHSIKENLTTQRSWMLWILHLARCSTLLANSRLKCNNPKCKTMPLALWNGNLLPHCRVSVISHSKTKTTPLLCSHDSQLLLTSCGVCSRGQAATFYSHHLIKKIRNALPLEIGCSKNRSNYLVSPGTLRLLSLYPISLDL
jgi:hypothetical protein